MVLPRRWQRSLFILFNCGRNGGTFSWCISRWRSMVLYRYFCSVPSVAIFMSMLHSAMAGVILLLDDS